MLAPDLGAELVVARSADVAQPQLDDVLQIGVPAAQLADVLRVGTERAVQVLPAIWSLRVIALPMWFADARKWGLLNCLPPTSTGA